MGDEILGGLDTSDADGRYIYLSEVVVLTKQRDVSPNESLTISESVSLNFVFNKSLGSQTLGTVTLG